MKVDPTSNTEDVTIQAPVVCDKHPDCCAQKGCPGLYKVLPGNKLAFQNSCCYINPDE
jgi:hypothetical protein